MTQKYKPTIQETLKAARELTLWLDIQGNATAADIVRQLCEAYRDLRG